MNWMHYLIEANLYMAAFYVLYLLFLRSETHYQLNRAYLLSTCMLAFVIPFFQLGVLKPGADVLQQHISIGEAATTGYTMQVLPDTVAAVATPKYTLTDYLLFVYAGVAIVLLINLCIRIYLLIALARKGSVTQNTSYNIIEMHQGSVAFSFFNNLFIDNRLASSQTILYHEQVHIRQKHSWDIIYLEIVKIMNWFNPVVYLLIASIKEVHEFIADEETVKLEHNNDSYTDFLISNAYGITQNTLTNSFFNKNLLKRRITMLYQKKSGKAARLKYLLALPLMAGLLCLSTLAFTTKTYGWVDLAPHSKSSVAATELSKSNSAGIVTASVEDLTNQPTNPQDKNENKVFSSPETQPEFPGGISAFSSFLSKNVRYPAIDKERKVQGKVYVGFIVERNGSITDVRIERSPSKTLSAEAIRVVKLSPKWVPGKQNGKLVRVAYIVPINFSLGNKVTASKLPTEAEWEGSVKSKLPPPNVSSSTKDSEVFTAVEVQPEFPGGISALSKFVQAHVRYPKEDHDNKVQGRAYIQFIVEQDGSVDNLKVLRTPSDAMGKEAMRVIASSPKWKPGMQDGKPVRVEFTMPINFALSDDGPNAPFNINIQSPPVNKITLNDNLNAVYTAVEIQPEFPGGVVAGAKFLQQNIHYPAIAKQNKVQGKVYIQFVVEKDGGISDIKVLREPGSGTGDEAVRVMKLSPKWVPGMVGGKPVRAQFTLPISFALGDASGMIKPVKKSNTDNAIASTAIGTPPQFPGGQKVFEKFLAGSILYPEQDKKNVIEGMVLAQFIIEKDGKLDKIKITQSPTKAMADEAIRVLTSSPKWTPGQQDGKAVRVVYNVPINFSLTSTNKMGNFFGNINMGKDADMPDRFYRMHDNMVRPQMVYIQVDKSLVNVVPNQPIEFGSHSVYLIEDKIYTKVDLERRSAAISSNDRVKTLFHAQTSIYHKPNNKEDIDKYGEIAKEGMTEFKNVVSSNL